MDNKTYDDIKRAFNSTRNPMNIGYLMTKFSMGFFEVKECIEKLLQEGVIREFEDGYVKIPPDERPAIKKVDEILSKLDADTAEYCYTLTEGRNITDCLTILSICKNTNLYFFESRLERAGFLKRRQTESENPMLAIDADEYVYFKKKIGKYAQDLREKADIERLDLRPRRLGYFTTGMTERTGYSDRHKEALKKLATNAVYNRLRARLTTKIKIIAEKNEWTYDIEYKGHKNNYQMRFERSGSGLTTDGLLYINNEEVYNYIKRSPNAEEKFQLKKLMAYYKVCWVTSPLGFECLCCKAASGEDDFDVILRAVSFLDVLHAIKEAV